MRNRPHHDEGFTLVELLVVIVVLGVLATITVFAVRGITDQGEESARVSDEKTLVTAEEAHMARFGSYADEITLVTVGLLTDESQRHDITLEPSGDTYTIVPAGSGVPMPPDPPPPPDVPPAPDVPVPTSFAGFAGESFGSGPNRIVVISDGTQWAAQWASFVAAGNTLATTEVVWLGAGDVTSTADVDAIVAAGPTYLVAANSVPVGGTFVGQYLSSVVAPDDFWWGHNQGGLALMLAHYTSVVVPGG